MERLSIFWQWGPDSPKNLTPPRYLGYVHTIRELEGRQWDYGTTWAEDMSGRTVWATHNEKENK
jgi:hypothetical protein